MPLPIVPSSVRQQVWDEVHQIEARQGSFAIEVTQRLRAENPEVAELLLRIFELYQGRQWLAKAIAYGCFVYRMLEIASGDKLPSVKVEVGAPMQLEFFQNPEQFCSSLAERLMCQNQQVVFAVTDFTFFEVLDEEQQDLDAAAMILYVGIVVYRFIESQVEADEMASSFQ